MTCHIGKIVQSPGPSHFSLPGSNKPVSNFCLYVHLSYRLLTWEKVRKIEEICCSRLNSPITGVGIVCGKFKANLQEICRFSGCCIAPPSSVPVACPWQTYIHTLQQEWLTRRTMTSSRALTVQTGSNEVSRRTADHSAAVNATSDVASEFS